MYNNYCKTLDQLKGRKKNNLSNNTKVENFRACTSLIKTKLIVMLKK